MQEFAQESSLVQELSTMLGSRSPGSLSVAYDVTKVGQNKILAAALAAALGYVNDPSASHSEIRSACSVIRDFGTDADFNQLVQAIRGYQYRDQKQYDELWRDTIYSENDRERAVLEILLADQRMYDSRLRYSDVARFELAQLRKLKPTTR